VAVRATHELATGPFTVSTGSLSLAGPDAAT
jgi:hypothetical protein